MVLKKIILKNFRNYENLSIELNEKVNIFIGDNAQGKTNLLESIYVLAITKSFRLFNDKTLIKSEQKFLSVKGIIRLENREKDDELEVFINNKGKKVIINKVIIKKTSDYLSNLNVIIFCPSDLDIVKGSPFIRRKFLNVELSQLFNKYLVILGEYNALLKDRNDYLKVSNINDYDKNYLNILTDHMINRAADIYIYRKKFIDELNINVSKIYSDIFDSCDIKIKYETSIPIENIDIEFIKQTLLKKYRQTLNREMLMSQTLIGPHRDDFSFYINGKEIKTYGSQGQQRMAALCLKLGEIEIFKRLSHETPIVLLDDIFSELDGDTKNSVISYIKGDFQTIITTTDINNVSKELLNNATVYYVENATITIGRGENDGR